MEKALSWDSLFERLLYSQRTQNGACLGSLLKSSRTFSTGFSKIEELASSLTHPYLF